MFFRLGEATDAMRAPRFIKPLRWIATSSAFWPPNISSGPFSILSNASCATSLGDYAVEVSKSSLPQDIDRYHGTVNFGI